MTLLPPLPARLLQGRGAKLARVRDAPGLRPGMPDNATLAYNAPVPVTDVPDNAAIFGFSNRRSSVHAARAMMLAELRLLLAACPPPADVAAYRKAAVDENVALKRTAARRLETFLTLQQLYGLSGDVLLFRALRSLWDADPLAQPLLAVLCAAARDTVLRATAKVIHTVAVGETVTPQMLSAVVEERFPAQYSPSTVAVIGRQAASTWQQAGHLAGRQRKVRAHVQARPTAAAYALLLGYLCGARGEGLFQTVWASILDGSVATLHEQAVAASQRGWLEYRRSGNVVDITFRHLLRGCAEGLPR